MALTQTDLPLELLREYSPALAVPEDFDAFWEQTLAESRAAAGPIGLERVEGPFRELVVEDLTFPGYAGEPIRAWVTRPHGDEPRPTVVEFVGYNGGRGLAGEKLAWAAAGFVHVLMDTRGQGSGWGNGGDTPDPHGSGPATAGFMTRGITSPQTYYYRRVFTDAVLLVDAVRGFAEVDADRVAVTGISQGGGIAIAASALCDGLVGVMPDVPFLCHFARAVTLVDTLPYGEIVQYLAGWRQHVDTAFRTLSYFDGVNFARRAQCPALFSVGLMDTICPPSTVYAAYNHYAADDKQIEVYPFNNHEGGQDHQLGRQLDWFAERLA